MRFDITQTVFARDSGARFLHARVVQREHPAGRRRASIEWGLAAVLS